MDYQNLERSYTQDLLISLIMFKIGHEDIIFVGDV